MQSNTEFKFADDYLWRKNNRNRLILHLIWQQPKPAFVSVTATTNMCNPFPAVPCQHSWDTGKWKVYRNAGTHNNRLLLWSTSKHSTRDENSKPTNHLPQLNVWNQQCEEYNLFIGIHLFSLYCSFFPIYFHHPPLLANNPVRFYFIYPFPFSNPIRCQW